MLRQPIKIKFVWGILFLLSMLLAGCATMETTPPPSATVPEIPTITDNYPLPPAGDDLIGHNLIIQASPGESLNRLAQRFDIGVAELKAANPGITTAKLTANTSIIIPREYILPPPQYRKGIVINVAELRIFYFTPQGTVMTFPVALGREGWHTPLGKTYVYRKEQDPTWNVPKSIRDSYREKTGKEHPLQIPPGPENPLGQYAIFLHMDGYLIHGTNDPDSIGRVVSSGCIRMHNQDVKQLFEQVKRGTPVTIVYYPNKVGWRDGKLYLEADRLIPFQIKEYEANTIPVEQLIKEALMNHSNSQVNPQELEKVLRAHTGIPTVIGN